MSNIKNIEEKDLISRVIIDSDEMVKAFNLRYEIFCKKLKWVKESQNELEIDRYDPNAVHFGLFNKDNSLLSYLRVILPQNRFMIENDFKNLVNTNYKVRKLQDTVEISRFCVSKEIYNFKFKFKPYTILYKHLFMWASTNKIRYAYIVVENLFFNQLKNMNIFCKKISRKEEETKSSAVVGIIDRNKTKVLMEKNRTEFSDWFLDY
jgi:N-acyl-L-homoserine lactone synthetase